MRQAWGEFLATARPGSHAGQVYAHPAELVESVAAFVAGGLELGEAAVLVTVPERLPPLEAALAAAGWRLAAAQEAGLLVVADAEATLAAIAAEDGALSPARFEDLVGGLLDRVAGPERRVRVFGEMVDVLCRRGDLAAANELERLWNDLAGRRDFALLCGYGLDVFDPAAQGGGAAPRLSRALPRPPARNYARFARAVDEALRDVLGPTEAAAAYLQASREAVAASRDVPPAQLLLMWVARHAPGESERVLGAARAHYAQA